MTLLIHPISWSFQVIFSFQVWPGKEADGSEPSTTPGKTPGSGKERMQKLAKLAKKHRNGYMPEVDWLDRLTFREIEHINEAEKRLSRYFYLMVEFPQVRTPPCNGNLDLVGKIFVFRRPIRTFWYRSETEAW